MKKPALRSVGYSTVARTASRGTSKTGRGRGKVRGRKLADVVAEKIEARVIDRMLPPGTVLGTELQLLAKYKVSRSVLRQAVKLLEHHQVARMRPGPNSGLIVTECHPAPVEKALSVYLRREGVTLSQVLEMKRSLEITCVRLAAERITYAGVERLRRAVATEREAHPERTKTIGPENIHLLLAELSGNPAMHLIVQSLTNLTLPHATDITHESAERTFAAHSRVAEAVIAGDVASATQAMREHLDDLSESLDE
ncbi:MAG: FCD domain-containing protein [Steroidobacteraceae bacterium]